jgi:hypothetical protein
MTSYPFELIVVTKGVLKTAIAIASKRLWYCAPGADEEIAAALAEAVTRLPDGSVYIHIDPSDRSLLTGYGTGKGVEILAELRKVRIAESWRLGLLIADNEAYIYTPAPEAKERSACPEDMPNGVMLRGSIAEQLLDCLRGENTLPLLEPKSTTSNEASSTEPTNQIEVKQEASQPEPNPRIPAPKEARKMDLVRRLFKLVRFHHSLTLADKKVRLTAKDFGFRTEGIDPQLSISFNVVTDEHRKTIKKILSGVEREVEKHIRSGLIKSLPSLGYVVWYENPREFEDTFAEVKSGIAKQINEWFDANYEKVQETSKSLVEKFLSEDLFERVMPAREPRHRGMTEAEFRAQWVEEKSKKFELPSADEVKKTLKIDFDLLDISEQMIANADFRKHLENAFGINLEEMLERTERPDRD